MGRELETQKAAKAANTTIESVDETSGDQTGNGEEDGAELPDWRKGALEYDVQLQYRAELVEHRCHRLWRLAGAAGIGAIAAASAAMISWRFLPLMLVLLAMAGSLVFIAESDVRRAGRMVERAKYTHLLTVLAREPSSLLLSVTQAADRRSGLTRNNQSADSSDLLPMRPVDIDCIADTESSATAIQTQTFRHRRRVSALRGLVAVSVVLLTSFIGGFIFGDVTDVLDPGNRRSEAPSAELVNLYMDTVEGARRRLDPILDELLQIGSSPLPDCVGHQRLARDAVDELAAIQLSDLELTQHAVSYFEGINDVAAECSGAAEQLRRQYLQLEDRLGQARVRANQLMAAALP